MTKQIVQSTLQPKRALILDFDGVVVDTEKLHFDCWNLAFDELLGLQLEGSHQQLVGLSLDAIYQRWLQLGKLQDGSQVPPTLSASMQEQLLERKTELYFELGQNLLEPMPGLTPLIRHVQSLGWYVTIASRSRRMRLLRTIEMVGLPPLFDLIMGYEDVADLQTDRKVHTRTITCFGIEPAACVVIEDSVSGIQDALNCGVGFVVGLTTSLIRKTLFTAGAHAVIDHLDEVMVQPSSKISQRTLEK
ncbi:HAD family phosphatase [Chloroflexi bacterium TSY]|nr:HAD family phosphatase [Chloroflexi bacterium TSY]